MKLGMGHNGESGANIGGNTVENYLQRDMAKQSQRPYSIEKDEIVGRHMVAARDIAAGEIIMEDIPLTYGPTVFTGNDVGSRPVCLGCYSAVSGSYLCPCCQWPMCSESCANLPIHKLNECGVFQQNNFVVDASKLKYGCVEPLYSCISPIRGLLLRESNPEHWSLIWNLMSHNEQRKETPFWKNKHEQVANILRDCIGLAQYSVDLIDTLLGIFLVNDFEVDIKQSDEFKTQDSSPLRGLYSLCSLPNHSCVANTLHTFHDKTQNYRMTVRAVTNITKGQDITHSYVEPLQTILVRQQILTLGKFFHCQCPRCEDPTELGTFASALLCQCKGTIVMSDTRDIGSTWKCSSCGVTLTSAQVSTVTSQAKQQADLLEYDASNLNKCGIPAHEKFLEKFSTVLHPNNVIMIHVAYCLCKMYGRMPGYEAPQLSTQQYQRKKQLCQNVLMVFNKLIPGKTRMRGLVMYELHLPLVMLANRNLQLGPAGGAEPNQIKADLREGLNYLRMALNILSSQPEGSFEAKIVAGSVNSVQELEGWVKTVSESI